MSKNFLNPEFVGSYSLLPMVQSGNFLKSLLHDLGLSKSAFARMLGITDRTVRNWMSSPTLPRDADGIISDKLLIPLEILRAAVEGARELPAEFRSRQELFRRQTAFASRRDEAVAGASRPLRLSEELQKAVRAAAANANMDAEQWMTYALMYAVKNGVRFDISIPRAAEAENETRSTAVNRKEASRPQIKKQGKKAG